MIINFANKVTESIFHKRFVKRISPPLQRSANRKLLVLDNISELRDLNLPGYNLEPLHGDREGQYSIRVNDQYRICFRFENGFCYDVELVDYHK